MTDDEFELRLDRLRGAIDQLVGLLGEVDDSAWSPWFSDVNARLDGGDRHALEHIVAAFGGMGSLNDLVIHPLNGHRVERLEVDAVNQRLDDLRNTISSEARALRRAVSP